MAERQTTDQQVEGALALAPKDRGAIKVDDQGLAFESAAEVFRISEAFVQSNVAPKGSTPGGVMAAILKGRALGLDEVTAMSSISVVNGRVQMSGALILALVRRRRACAELEYWWEGEGNQRAAYVRARRVDEARATTHRFGLDDAARGGLAGKDVYKAWGDDMLLWRAVSRMGRRQFSDVLAGVYVPGEVSAPTPAESSSTPPAPDTPLAPPPADPLLEELAPAQGSASEPETPATANPEASPRGNPAAAEERRPNASETPPESSTQSPPFASHAQADRAIAKAEGQGDLFDGAGDR